MNLFIQIVLIVAALGVIVLICFICSYYFGKFGHDSKLSVHAVVRDEDRLSELYVLYFKDGVDTSYSLYKAELERLGFISAEIEDVDNIFRNRVVSYPENTSITSEIGPRLFETILVRDRNHRERYTSVVFAQTNVRKQMFVAMDKCCARVKPRRAIFHPNRVLNNA